MAKYQCEKDTNCVVMLSGHYTSYIGFIGMHIPQPWLFSCRLFWKYSEVTIHFLVSYFSQRLTRFCNDEHNGYTLGKYINIS